VVAATLLFLAMIGLLVAALPCWSYSRSWGTWPSRLIGATVGVLLVLALVRGM
jgi:hypothetical protein